MFPVDLVIAFGDLSSRADASSGQVFQAADLSTTATTGPTKGEFYCQLVGPDGGTAGIIFTNAASIMCSAQYNADVTVSITGTGIQPFKAQLHNGTDCQSHPVNVDYVLLASSP